MQPSQVSGPFQLDANFAGHNLSKRGQQDMLGDNGSVRVMPEEGFLEALGALYASPDASVILHAQGLPS